MRRVSPEEVLHVALCQAVGLMNGSPVFAQSEDGQQVRDILRTALTEYADAYMDQPVTEAERAAMILGHANSAVDIQAVPDDFEWLRVVAVEAIRNATGCPDIRGKDGDYLTDGLIRLAKLARPSAAPTPPADARRLRLFEQWADQGYAPALVFDDDGRWAVSFTSVSPVPPSGGFTDAEQISVLVEPHEWHDSVNAAIDAAQRKVGDEED